MKKRFFILPILSLIFLIGAGYLVFFTEPALPTIFLFFICIFSFLFFIFSFVFRNSRRGVFIALFLTGALILQFFRLANWLTLLLLFVPLMLLEVYFSSKSK